MRRGASPREAMKLLVCSRIPTPSGSPGSQFSTKTDACPQHTISSGNIRFSANSRARGLHRISFAASEWQCPTTSTPSRVSNQAWNMVSMLGFFDPGSTRLACSASSTSSLLNGESRSSKRDRTVSKRQRVTWSARRLARHEPLALTSNSLSSTRTEVLPSPRIVSLRSSRPISWDSRSSSFSGSLPALITEPEHAAPRHEPKDNSSPGLPRLCKLGTKFPPGHPGFPATGPINPDSEEGTNKNIPIGRSKRAPGLGTNQKIDPPAIYPKFMGGLQVTIEVDRTARRSYYPRPCGVLPHSISLYDPFTACARRENS